MADKETKKEDQAYTRVKVYATKKGEENKANSWKEGQEIECSEKLADYFITHGVATKTKGGK
jgi:hypothetical protein